MMGVIDELSAMQDSSFGCPVANRFDRLLDDEADPFDILREAKVEKQKKKKKEDQKKAEPGKPGKKESQKDRRIPVIGGPTAPLRVGQTPGEERGGKRVVFSERRYNDIEAPLEYSIEKPQEQSDRGARGGRGGARGRGGRGGAYPRNVDAADQRGKREFDRHSGSVKTGVRPEEKRGGSGSHNWGSMKDHMSAVVDGTNEDGGVAEAVQEPVEVDGKPREGDGKSVKAEMSLDEWKALQQQSRPKMELNLRRADTSVPSKAVVIHKSKHLEDASEAPVEEEDDGHYFRRPTNDITSRLKINFGCLERPMRGGRWGRGQGGPSPSPETEPEPPFEGVPAPAPAPAPAPNPDDHDDFPALTTGEA
ncbi:hypothetical protein AAFF_G00372540 [Aldrovandia affinis]|uniref:Hyaluronan/mRNA-binding protein domain-containing protein n=1 Tax=Aldrovandia affinis TaxID=143900 RepID=A0AAD7SGC0_9TELE|nr:hypothetical protein AAFF_G00372540 [Aldrovandia affinis]